MLTLAANHKAHYNYERLESFEAGLSLTGQEVKSIRHGGAKIDAGHVTLRTGRLWLIGVNIAPYKKATHIQHYDPVRTRELLLHKKEIMYLASKLGEKGLTLIPVSLYTRGNRIKAEIWLARGKKSYEKREKIKNRDIRRETERWLSGRDD